MSSGPNLNLDLTREEESYATFMKEIDYFSLYIALRSIRLFETQKKGFVRFSDSSYTQTSWYKNGVDAWDKKMGHHLHSKKTPMDTSMKQEYVKDLMIFASVAGLKFWNKYTKKKELTQALYDAYIQDKFVLSVRSVKIGDRNITILPIRLDVSQDLLVRWTHKNPQYTRLQYNASTSKKSTAIPDDTERSPVRVPSRFCPDDDSKWTCLSDQALAFNLSRQKEDTFMKNILQFGYDYNNMQVIDVPGRKTIKTKDDTDEYSEALIYVNGSVNGIDDTFMHNLKARLQQENKQFDRVFYGNMGDFVVHWGRNFAFEEGGKDRMSTFLIPPPNEEIPIQDEIFGNVKLRPDSLSTDANVKNLFEGNTYLKCLKTSKCVRGFLQSSTKHLEETVKQELATAFSSGMQFVQKAYREAGRACSYGSECSSEQTDQKNTPSNTSGVRRSLSNLFSRKNSNASSATSSKVSGARSSKSS